MREMEDEPNQSTSLTYVEMSQVQLLYANKNV
jgi:hypothetical protein